MTKLIKYIEMDEFKKILKAEKDRDFKLAYALAFGSGLRISEIVGLKEHISRCCKSEILEQMYKLQNGKKRQKFICSECENKLTSKDLIRSKTKFKIYPLETHQIDLKRHTIKVLGKGSKERITCTSPWLNESNLKLLPLTINRRTLQNRFKGLCKKTLKRNLNFHTLRHGFANYMANEKGMSLPLLQALGGWSRLDTLGIYTKANPIKAINKAWESF